MTDQVLAPIGKIKPNPYQPRTTEDLAAIAELAVNIYRNGLMQVPTARAVNGHYELVFGHTRKAAYELLATKGVPAAEIKPDKRFAEMPLNIHALDDRQMFEMAVAENIKRRDLNSIETAIAIERYMKDFEATSKQAGELFGVNEATIRGKVRLLDLPKEVQSQVADGKISESTARTLLSMKKLSSDKVVIDTAKQIEKNGGRELPESIIESKVDHLQNVVEMWSDRNDGKPRASSRIDLWHLDEQNFPNEKLPALTYKDVIEALKINETPRLKALAEGTLSFYDLLEKLKKANDPEAARIEHLLNPTACISCPFYTKVRGTHFCGMKVCHSRKAQAWADDKLSKAAKSLKIEIYNSGRDGKYKMLENWDSKSARLFTTRHKDLRLLERRKVKDSYVYQSSFTGVDASFFLVVATGAALKALIDKSPTGGTTIKGNTDRSRQREIRLFRKKTRELVWEFTLIGKTLFQSINKTVCEQLDSWKFLGVDDRPTGDMEPPANASADIKADHVRRLLILNLLSKDFSHFTRIQEKSLVKVAKKLESYAKEWGVKMPSSIMKLAEEGDREIKAVAAETKRKK